MKNFFKKSLINELCESRRIELSNKVIKSSKKYKDLRDSMEKKLKSFLKYISEENRASVEREMDDFIFEYVLQFVEYWDNLFYRFGFVDGMSLNKEIRERLEKELNGEIEKDILS